MTLLRRLASIGVLWCCFLFLGALAPLILPVAALVDLLRRGRLALLRAYAFGMIYLGAELLGVGAAFLLWLRPGRQQWLKDHYRLQRWWVRTLFESARRLYQVDVQVVGAEHARTGPLLLLVRHISVADTLLPTRMLSDPYGLKLRFVLKQDLLLDPCLDIVGQRLPNAFVARGSREREDDLRAVRQLLDGLGEDDGVMLFPEGTRFTEARRTQVLTRLAEHTTPELLAKAQRLEHVLPPRLGGLLTLLEGRPGLDVVFCAHTGFEGATKLSDFWRGSLIKRRVQIAFWRVAGDTIPRDQAAQIDWIYQQWQRVDDWVRDHPAEPVNSAAAARSPEAERRADP